MRKRPKKNPKITTAAMENAPFENLFEILDADTRNSIIETMFHDRINLLKQSNRQKIVELQLSEIKRTESIIIMSEGYIETCKRDKAEAQTEIDNILEGIKELRKTVEFLRGKIQKLDGIQKNYQKYLDGKKKELKEKEELSKNINTVVLVHPTCSLKDLIYYDFSEIYVTKLDRRIFRRILPDKVWELSEDKLITLPEYYSDYLKEHYESSAERSIIAYCEMVAHVKMEMDDVNIVLLFNNEDIHKILEWNGLM